VFFEISFVFFWKCNWTKILKQPGNTIQYLLHQEAPTNTGWLLPHVSLDHRWCQQPRVLCTEKEIQRNLHFLSQCDNDESASRKPARRDVYRACQLIATFRSCSSWMTQFEWYTWLMRKFGRVIPRHTDKIPEKVTCQGLVVTNEWTKTSAVPQSVACLGWL